MTYHPDKPCEVQEIELHMHELTSFERSNHWHLKHLIRWLGSRPNQIWEANQRLRAFFAECGVVPQEVTDIDNAISQLINLEVSSYGNIPDLGKWLETYPNLIFDATLRLENILEDMFPTITHIEVDRGSLQPHYHQAV